MPHSHQLDLIQQHQFAFVKESPTSYNCIDQNSRFMEIGYGQTEKGYMRFLFLALDVIAHASLLDKLQAYGVRGTAVEWMRTIFLIELSFFPVAVVAFLIGVPEGVSTWTDPFQRLHKWNNRCPLVLLWCFIC